MYFVIPDEAVENMTVAYEGEAYTLKNHRPDADTRMQKSALRKQIGAFFLMPFALPFIMTVPVGLVFGEVYEIWNFSGLDGGHAMGAAADFICTF